MRVTHDKGEAGGKDLAMDALLFGNVFAGTGKRGMMQDLITFSAQDRVAGGAAEIAECAIGKDNGVVRVDNKDRVGEMVKDSILILW